MDSCPTSPNNKFVESGRKSQSESREKISVVSVKGEELHIQKCKKASSVMPQQCDQQFRVLSFYCCISSTFLSFLFFSCPPLFEFLFVLYTMVFAPFSPSTCESGVGSFPVPSRTSLNLLLLAVRLLVYCSGITFTLLRPESWLRSI